MKTMKLLLAILALAGMPALSPAPAVAAEFKVLVVMSYEEHNPWVEEIRRGINSVLGASSEITYFYMDTKVNREGGPKKAEEAFALYQKLQPNGVIAADDDAQSMFVVPFLKNRVDTPVMFNGVNAAAAQYGFPASNVSGILERAHVRESLAFVKQLLPSVRTACFIVNDVPAGAALRAQVDAEKESYPARVKGFHLLKTSREIEVLGKQLTAACDTVFVDSLEGILGADRKPLDNREVLKVLANAYGGPILAGNRYQVEQGALAAVAKTGQEQGETAAAMLLQAMRGTPVARIPVAKNVRGQRIINVTVLEARRIQARPIVLRGAELVKTQP